MLNYAAPSTTFDPLRDLPDLTGKVVIVTGSSGIGFASLQHLCRKGAKVYMATPDEDQTKEALERVEKAGREPGLGEVFWHELDLKDPKTAKDSAERFLQKENRLDLLVNNAALISDRGNLALNQYGLTNNMSINYLGPFVFTQTLLPLLEKTSGEGGDTRIINVGSQGHAEIDYSSYGSKDAWNHKFSFTMLPTLSRYKYTKLAVHLWSNHLARRLTASQSKILLIVVHPGAILSVSSSFIIPLRCIDFRIQDGAIRNLKTVPFTSFWVWLLGTMMHPQEQGAFTTVFAACTPRDDVNIEHGAYIMPPNVIGKQSKVAMDSGKQDELFEFTKKLLKDADIAVEVLACDDHVHEKRAIPSSPLTPPHRPLEWGDINILHTTDTHGWLLGHQKASFPEPNYSGDFGDYASFVAHMKKIALKKDVDLLLVDSGDTHDGTGLTDGHPPGGVNSHDSNKYLAQLPYDVMAIGNHELYVYANTLDMHTNFVPNIRGHYLSSNANITVNDQRGRPVSVPVGKRYAKFKTRKYGILLLLLYMPLIET
ncbi:hypothetical protein ONZ45_g9512 [Pleurotus djamor]|nr:hypothetical protein ONZ45_g9512 [Pleurotus djamor]